MATALSFQKHTFKQTKEHMKQAHSCLISDTDQISSRSPFHLRAGICLTTHTHIQVIPATLSKIMTLLSSRHRYAAVHEAAKAKAGNGWENRAEVSLAAYQTTG
jgi:hypothetical protein